MQLIQLDILPFSTRYMGRLSGMFPISRHMWLPLRILGVEGQNSTVAFSFAALAALQTWRHRSLSQLLLWIPSLCPVLKASV